MTTLGVECFSKGMRADHDMPTVTGYVYRRARCMEDDMLRIYQKHFFYFTGPNSYYPEKIIKSDSPEHHISREQANGYILRNRQQGRR